MEYEEIIERLEKLERQNAGLQALFTTIDDKLTDIYEVMFRKRENRESIITVFKVIFGSDSVITFDGNDLVVKTNNDRAIDMKEINIKLMKIGKRCELSKTRIPNDRYNISYVFKITRW